MVNRKRLFSAITKKSDFKTSIEALPHAQLIRATSSNLVEKLKHILVGGYQKVLALNQQITNLRGGLGFQAIESLGCRAPVSQFGVVCENLLKLAQEVIEGHNISLKEYHPYQRYWQGELSKQSPGIEVQLLVSVDDLLNLETQLTRMINIPGISQRLEVWNGFLKIITGESSCKDYATGDQLSAEECNKMRQSIPIQVGFMRYTQDEFVNLSTAEMNQVRCEAEVIRAIVREVNAERRVKKVHWRDKVNCNYKLETTEDLNGDGRVVKKGRGSPRYPEDSYHFLRSGLESTVMWLPVDTFRVTE